MNYIDIGFLVLLALSLLFGLLGKAKNKIRHMVVLIVSCVTAYFTFGLVKNYVLSIQVNDQALGVLISSKLAEVFAGNESLAGLANTVLPLTDALCGLLVFWLEILVLLIVFGIIAKIFDAIRVGKIKRKYKRTDDGRKYRPMKAVRLFGIPSLISGFISWIYILLPILFLAPVVSAAGNLISIIPDLGENEKVVSIVTTVSDQFKNSRLIELSGKVFELDGNKLVEYEVDGEKKNAYKDLKSINDLSKAASLIQAIMPQDGEDVDPNAILSSLKDMPEEDLTAVLNAIDDNKDIILSIVPADALQEIGLDLNEIKLADEVPALEVVLDIIEFNEGEMSFNVENLDNTKLTNALIESNLLNTFIQPGMLVDLPEENKTAITEILNERLAAEENAISQEKYDLIMSYFEEQIEE